MLCDGGTRREFVVNISQLSGNQICKFGVGEGRGEEAGYKPVGRVAWREGGGGNAGDGQLLEKDVDTTATKVQDGHSRLQELFETAMTVWKGEEYIWVLPCHIWTSRLHFKANQGLVPEPNICI